MKAKDLISRLQTMPPDATVFVMYDGYSARHAELAWLSRSDDVILSGYNQPVYNDSDRPPNSPTTGQDRYWSTKDDPEDELD